MSIADVKAGGWAQGERFRSPQANSVRAELLKCVDGVGGGTYTPSATVSISDLMVGGGNRLKYDGTNSVTKALRVAVIHAGTTPEWVFNSASTTLRWAQTGGVAAGDTLTMQVVDLPSAGTLTSIHVAVRGNPVSRANLTFNLPRFFFNKRPVLSETVTQIVSSQVDASASVAAYEAIHLISATGLSENLETGAASNYYLGVTGESGGGTATAGLRFLGAYGVVTFAEQAEW